MGFSGLMGFASGAARAGEQVMDANIARLDAAGVARAKEEAQLRLEERTERAANARLDKGYAHDAVLHKQSREEKVADTATALIASRAAEKEAYDLSVNPDRVAKSIATANTKHTGLMSSQESSAKNKSEINASNAKAAHDQAAAKKLLSEIGAGGTKPLTEAEIANRVEVGDKGLRIAYNIGTDLVTGQYTGKAEDVKGYITAKAKLERAVRNNESLPAAYVEKLSAGTEAEKSAAQAKEDSVVKAAVENINKNSKWYKSNITPEEFKKLPQEEQDKAINQAGQSKSPSTPKIETKTPALPPIATRKDGDVIEVGGVKRSWNSQANGGKGGWGLVQETPAVPTKPRGLMSNAGAATMPAEDLVTRSAAARQRMNDLAKKTGYVSQEERDAVKNLVRANNPQQPEIAPGSTPESKIAATKLQPINAADTSAKEEAAYSALVKSNVSVAEYIKGLEPLLNNPDFRKNHPEAVAIYKDYMDSKGSR